MEKHRGTTEIAAGHWGDRVSVGPNGCIVHGATEKFMVEAEKKLTIRPISKMVDVRTKPFKIFTPIGSRSASVTRYTDGTGAETKRRPGQAECPIKVPRNWMVNLLPALSKQVWGVEPMRMSQKGRDLSTTFTLSRHRMQHEQVASMLDTLKGEFAGGTLVVPCGYGKSSTALYVAGKVGYRTLIVVHKEFLMAQWRERIGQMYPGASVGTIQGDKCELQCDFTVAMLQTLVKRDYGQRTFEVFGLAIFDECHLMSTKHFSSIMQKVCCKYMLGLTATPDRPDGTFHVIEHYLGCQIYRCERSNEAISVTIEVVKTGVAVELELNRAQNINFAKMVNDLCGDSKRNDLILEHAVRIASAGHKTLLLTDRREHATLICSLLHDCGVVAATYLGAMKQDALAVASEADVICATFPMASTGLDIPALSALMLVTPHTNIEQAVGRVLRNTSGDSLVVDFVDDTPVTWASHQKRKTFYRKHGYHITSQGSIKQKGETSTEATGARDVAFCLLEED